MNQPFDRCANLQLQVNSLLDLLQQEPSLYPQQDTTAVDSNIYKVEVIDQQLQQVGRESYHHIEDEVNSIVNSSDSVFESDFKKLTARMVSRLDELLQTFSVRNAYSS